MQLRNSPQVTKSGPSRATPNDRHVRDQGREGGESVRKRKERSSSTAKADSVATRAPLEEATRNTPRRSSQRLSIGTRFASASRGGAKGSKTKTKTKAKVILVDASSDSEQESEEDSGDDFGVEDPVKGAKQREENSEDLDHSDHDDEPAPKKRRVSIKKEPKPSKPSALLTALRQNNIKLRDSLPTPALPPATDPTLPDTFCCLVCSAREFSRAVTSNSPQLLTTCLDTPQVGTWHDSLTHPWNPLTLATQQNRETLLHTLLTHPSKNTTPPAAYLHSQSTTGRQNYHAYGHAVKKVNESRGNREGNTAFYDPPVTILSYDFDKRGSPVQIPRTLEGAWLLAVRAACRLPGGTVLESTWDRLVLHCPCGGGAQEEFGRWALYDAVASGNRALANKMMMSLGEYSCFNSLHRESLGLTDPAVAYTKFRDVSVLKKASKELFSVKPLHFAAVNEDKGRLETLLEAVGVAVGVVEKDDFGRTVIHFAAVCEGTGPLEMLIEKGVDLRGVDASKMSPLLLAAKHGRVENVKILIAALGGDQDATDGTLLTNGFTALHFASGLGHLEVVKTLLDSKADPNRIDKLGKLTPLLHACRAGHLDVVKLLISKGANVFAADSQGKTGLIYACKGGHFDVLVALLKEGADASACDTSENSPLHYACAFGHKPIVQALLTFGQSALNARNAWKCTPLMIADMKGHYGITSHLLGLPGIAVNFLDKDGYGMVHLMFRSAMEGVGDVEGRVKQLKELLNHGADPNLKSVSGDTCLHLLLQWPFDTTQFTLPETTRCILACLHLLLDYGADIECVNAGGVTPLGVAVVAKRLGVVKALIEKGAKVENVKVEGGRNFVGVLMEAVVGVDNHLLGAVRDCSDFKVAFERVEREVGEMGKELEEVMEVLGREELRGVIAAQLRECDLEGFTPLLRSLHVGIPLQDASAASLEKACRDQRIYNYSWLPKSQHQPPIDPNDLFVVNLNRTFACWSKTVKSLVKHVDASILNARVQLPANFKKEHAKEADPKYTGYTLLHFAAAAWNCEVVETLVDAGAVADVEEVLGSTPLALCLETGAGEEEGTLANADKCKFVVTKGVVRQCGTVQALLRGGANPLVNDGKRESAMLKVLKRVPLEKEFATGVCVEVREMVEGMVEACGRFSGVEGVNVGCKVDGKTCVIVALEKGYDKFVATFIKAGASMDVVGPNKVPTALLAIRQGRVTAVEMVLSANLAVSDASGQTCAMAACLESDEIATLVLGTHGSLDINRVNKAHETALIVAVKNMRGVSVVARVLEKGVNVNYAGPDGKTALVWAIETNKIDVVRLLIDHNADVNVQDRIPGLGQWALHYAVLSRNSKIVAVLLDKGANPDCVRAQDFATPLHVAVEESKKEVNKSLKVERSLIQCGASVNAVDAQGRTPLHIAFFGLGKIPVMQLTAEEMKVRDEYKELVAQNEVASRKLKEYVEAVSGATLDGDKAKVFEWFYRVKAKLPEYAPKSVQDKRSEAEEYAFGRVEVADSTGKSDPVEIVDFLTGYSQLQPDIVDKFGRTPLHYAALIGASSCTNALLKAGVDLNRHDKDGNTPLQLSLLGEHVDFYLNLGLQGAKVKGHILLANGTTESNFFYALMKGFMSIGYFIKNNEEQNMCVAISDALRTGRYSLAMALASGASETDLRVVDSKGRTLVHVLADFDALDAGVWEEDYAVDMFEVVRKVGVDMNAVDVDSRTALVCASKHNQPVVLEMLVGCPGIELDLSDDSGATAVLNAVVSGSCRMVTCLLEKGARVDHGNVGKQVSVLRAAVDSKSVEMVALVLGAGASVDSREPSLEMTPLMKAVELGVEEIVALLIEHKVDLDRDSPYTLVGKDGKKEMVEMCPVVLAYSLKSVLFKKLATSGANLNGKHPQTHRTCLMEAMEKDDKEEIEFMFEHGADVNLVDPKTKQSCFQWGVLQSISPFKELSVELSRFSPAVSEPNSKTGWTLLDHAIQLSDLVMLKKLLALGADPNSRSLPSVNPNECTSLMLAVDSNNFDAVKLLIESLPNSANIHAVDKNGRNVIHHAVRPFDIASFENVELVSYLHVRGVSLVQKDVMGHIPIDYADLATSKTLFNCLRELGSPLCGTSVASSQEDEDMFESNEIPIENIESDALAERARLETLLQKEEDEQIAKEAQKRNVDVEVIRAERKKSEWVRVNPSASVDEKQVRVLFEGDGIEEYAPYSVLLHKCDVSRGLYGENKFYIMQILWNRLQDLHFLFNKWGDASILRTNGQTHDYGQFQKTPFNTKEDAIKEFKKVFKSKTGNEWDMADDFTKKPGKYVLVKTVKKRAVKVKPIDYEGVPASKLDGSVGEVVRMFLQVASAKPAGAYSDRGLPFDGALDAGRVNAAYDTLLTIRKTFKEMDAMIKDKTTIPSAKQLLALREKLVILSTDYFRLLPSTEGRFGLKPILTAEALSEEMVRANNLRYYDTSLMLLFAASQNRLKYNPIDYTCSALKCDIRPLGDGSEKELIRKWIGRSVLDHVDLLSVFRVDREGEADAFEDHHGEKKMLFHGSRMSNMLGILKSGLQVAPVEAPVSGYMFGKGIYFADVFAKSWGYIHDHVGSGDSSAYGCMFICEVAVGTSHESEDSISTLETAVLGSSSTKGLGKLAPNPSGDITFSKGGVKLPLGPIVESPLRKDPETNKDIEKCLTYNEFIVYNPAQVKIKYMLVLRDTRQCHLCVGATHALKPMSEYALDFEKFSALPRQLPFESEIVCVLLQENRMTGKDLWNRDLETKLVQGKKYLSRWNPSTGLKSDSKVCRGCADTLMMDLLEEYREENRDLICDELANRDDCWFGRECTTQKKSPGHAQKFNHCCDKIQHEKKDAIVEAKKSVEESDEEEEEEESEDGMDEDE
ncbi:hypothetical protein HDU98_002207 [Podochytrium sp. JEL0797]|nr:hypothetical protein HDU98_002207 [Podochytrium sp. JEL0797]